MPIEPQEMQVEMVFNNERFVNLQIRDIKEEFVPIC